MLTLFIHGPQVTLIQEVKVHTICVYNKLFIMFQVKMVAVVIATLRLPQTAFTIPTTTTTTQPMSTQLQVWPLTHFFFVSKIIDLPGGQINDPSWGKHCSLMFLPATPSSASWTLEGLFELTRCTSRAPTRIVRCFRNCRDTRTPSGVRR